VALIWTVRSLGSCVMIKGGSYIFFRPVWIVGSIAGEGVLKLWIEFLKKIGYLGGYRNMYLVNNPTVYVPPRVLRQTRKISLFVGVVV